VLQPLTPPSALTFDYIDEEEESEFAQELSIQMQPLLSRQRAHLLCAELLWLGPWDGGRAVEAVLSAMSMERAVVVVSSGSYGAGPAAVGAQSGLKPEEEQEPEEEEGEGEWEDDDEDDDEDEDEDEDEEGSKAGDGDMSALNGQNQVLSAADITALYSGPLAFLPLCLPPHEQLSVPGSPVPATATAAATATAIEEKALDRPPLIERHFGTEYWQDARPMELQDLWTPGRT
jgi:hypothetical protein